MSCATPLAPAGDHAQRKVVTALFCDLVGSTALGEALDPEMLQRVLGRYYGAMREAIERHGGSVEKFIGDAVVGIFGVPIAHEDDAVRAGRAALDMVAALPPLNEGVADLAIALHIRIGIESGEVVADASSPAGTIAGDAFNTAARLQAEAPINGVLMGEGAVRLLEGWAELDDVPPLQVKGKASPVRAAVLRSIAVSRALGTGTVFVGRARQLRSLRRAFDDAAEDRACALVTVFGPPGIGKSRLVDEFVQTLSNDAQVLLAKTPAYGDGVTFAPLVELIRAASGAPSSEDGDVVAGLLERVQGRPDGQAIVERLSAVLGIADASAVGDTSWAVRRLIECLSLERPVAIVLEDVHWAADALLDVIDDIAGTARGSILLLCVARPELLEQRPTWGGGKSRAMSIMLAPLPNADAATLAQGLLGDARADTVARVAAAAEGNPLYLEQIAASISESGDVPDAEIHAPPTIQALLASRLDRLNAVESAVISVAAVEGRRFHLGTIASLGTTSTDSLEAALAILDRRGFVAPEDETGSGWRFTHPLVWEAAYRRIPKERRAELHASLASSMTDPEHVERDEIVGLHLERAAALRRELGLGGAETDRLARDAGARLAFAGARAYAQMDLGSSVELFGRAVDLLPGDDPARLSLLPDLAVTLMETGRRDEARELLATASRRADDAGSEVDRLRVRIQTLSLHVYDQSPYAEIELAQDEARLIIERLETLGDRVGLAQAWVLIEYLSWALGDMHDIEDASLRAFRYAEAAGRPREQIQAGGDVGTYLAIGELDVAEIEAFARPLVEDPDPILRVSGHAGMSIAAALRGEMNSLQQHEVERRSVADTRGLEYNLVATNLGVAEALMAIGDFVQAGILLTAGVDAAARLGDIWAQSTHAWQRLATVQDTDEAEVALTLADEIATVPAFDRHTRVWRSISLSKTTSARGRDAESVRHARDAVAEARGSGLWLTWALASERLGMLVGDDGQGEEAEGHLREAFNLFERKGCIAGVERIASILGD